MRDNEHPFFRPLWRRIAVVGFCAAWAAFEFAMQAPLWGMIALAFGAYAVWQFFINFRPAGGPNQPKE